MKIKLTINAKLKVITHDRNKELIFRLIYIPFKYFLYTGMWINLLPGILQLIAWLLSLLS